MALYVNGELVDEKEIEAEVERLSPEYDRVFAEMDKEESQKQLLEWSRENVIERYMLKQAAENDNEPLEDGAVENAFETMIEQAGGRADFYNKSGLSPDKDDEIKKDITSRLKLERLMERISSSVSEPSEKEIDKYYSANTDKFTIPEMVRAAHIVKHPNQQDDIERVQQEMDEILHEIRTKDNFEELAQKYSDCPDNAGDLGYFPRGQMVQAFEDIAFAMEAGQVSDVFQTEFGFHIAKVTSKKPEVLCPVEEVREVIVKELNQAVGQKAIEKFIDSEKAKAVIEDK